MGDCLWHHAPPLLKAPPPGGRISVESKVGVFLPNSLGTDYRLLNAVLMRHSHRHWGLSLPDWSPFLASISSALVQETDMRCLPS